MCGSAEIVGKPRKSGIIVFISEIVRDDTIAIAVDIMPIQLIADAVTLD